MTPLLAGLDAALVAQGYTELSRLGLLRLMARLSEWMAGRGLEPSGVEEDALEAFVAMRRRAGCSHGRSVAGLRPMVEFLRSVGVLPPAPVVVELSVQAQLLRAYRVYLEQERGLAPITVAAHGRIAGRFITAHSNDDGLALELVGATQVGEFVVAECQRRSVRSGIITAVRCLLRFLFLHGVTDVELAGAVPAASGGGRTGLPRDVPAAHVAAILASCDRQTATGRRDFAVLTVLARLGLRATETALMSLDDIDWQAGDVVIRGKGRRVERLPLPGDVGEAIVAYLTDGRPAARSRVVFLTATAPLRRLAQPSMTDIVYRACERAGVARIGPHRLRHTAATAMLRQGGSLAEVAQVLRHHDPLTTATYAKVDRAALAELALPWPGADR